jgi:hypothetical protein
MSTIETRASETAWRHIIALHTIVKRAAALLVDVFGPMGMAIMGGALAIIVIECVRWLMT